MMVCWCFFVDLLLLRAVVVDDDDDVGGVLEGVTSCFRRRTVTDRGE